VLPSATSPTATIVAIGFAAADGGTADGRSDVELAGASVGDEGLADGLTVGIDDTDGAADGEDPWQPATNVVAAIPTSSTRLPRCRISTLLSRR
jgi:hypothetical protein